LANQYLGIKTGLQAEQHALGRRASARGADRGSAPLAGVHACAESSSCLHTSRDTWSGATQPVISKKGLLKIHVWKGHSIQGKYGAKEVITVPLLTYLLGQDQATSIPWLCATDMLLEPRRLLFSNPSRANRVTSVVCSLHATRFHHSSVHGSVYGVLLFEAGRPGGLCKGMQTLLWFPPLAMSQTSTLINA